MALSVLPSALTELGVSCRWAFRQPGWQARALFPHPRPPPVCLHVDSPAQWSQHIISLSALFALAPPPPLQCGLYYILIWPWASLSRATQALPMWALATQGSASPASPGGTQDILSLKLPFIVIFKGMSIWGQSKWRCTLSLFYQFTNKQFKKNI